MKILLVEDNPGDVELFRRLVLTDDDLLVAGSADEALQLMDDCDLAIVDLNLPDSRIDATLEKVVKPQSQKRPVVVLSRYDTERIVEKAGRSGACAFHVKGKSTYDDLKRQVLLCRGLTQQSP